MRSGDHLRTSSHWFDAGRFHLAATLRGDEYPLRLEKYGWTSGYLVDPIYGAVIYKVDNEGLWRFTFVEENTKPVESDEARIREFADAVLPGDKRFDLVLHSEYNMHQRTAATYRVGHILLAGDAAHVTNPTSGFGLMGGMYDAFVLSEALAAVVH